MRADFRAGSQHRVFLNGGELRAVSLKASVCFEEGATGCVLIEG